MNLALTRRARRPSWMTPFGHEGFGDVFFDRLWPEWRGDIGETLIPSVDLSEKDGTYTVTAELPGLKRDDISVSIEKGHLTLSGKKAAEKEEKGKDCYLKETREGSFSRSLELPGEVDEDKAEATYKDGILTVVMPKKGGPEHKKIEVN